MSKLMWVVALVALVGFVDATYLTVEHYRGEIPACSLVSGCEVVLTSAYAEVLGVPVALFGALGYVSVLLLALAWFDVRRAVIVWLVFVLSTVALFASAWFVYVQLFVLRAICQYCMVSAGTSTLLFALGLMMVRRLRGGA